MPTVHRLGGEKTGSGRQKRSIPAGPYLGQGLLAMGVSGVDIVAGFSSEYGGGGAKLPRVLR